MLEDAFAEDGDEGAEARDTGADNGDVRLEGGPDAEVDGSPCYGSRDQYPSSMIKRARVVI